MCCFFIAVVLGLVVFVVFIVGPKSQEVSNQYTHAFRRNNNFCQGWMVVPDRVKGMIQCNLINSSFIL